MLSLSTDTYIAIRFTILAGGLLGSMFAIITQKVSFRQKINFFILLLISLAGLLIYLDSIYKKYQFIPYMFSIIKNIWIYYIDGFQMLQDVYIIDSILSFFWVLLINMVLYYTTYRLLRSILFYKMPYSKKFKAQMPFAFTLLNITILIIDMGFSLAIPKHYVDEIMQLLSYSSDIMYEHLFKKTILNYLILYSASGLINNIGYRYFMDV